MKSLHSNSTIVRETFNCLNGIIMLINRSIINISVTIALINIFVFFAIRISIISSMSLSSSYEAQVLCSNDSRSSPFIYKKNLYDQTILDMKQASISPLLCSCYTYMVWTDGKQKFSYDLILFSRLICSPSNSRLPLSLGFYCVWVMLQLD